jgi:hypothetical protein
VGEGGGDPGRIRTCDLQLTRLILRIVSIDVFANMSRLCRVAGVPALGRH